MKKKINLSFKKLKELIEKYQYTLESIFCEDGLIKFLDCRSPLYQKSFLVFIPDRYSLKNTSVDIKKHDITLSQSTPSQIHIEHMSNMKGPEIECDLVILTGNDLFLYFDNGDYKYYHVKHPKKNPRQALGIHSLHQILKGSSLISSKEEEEIDSSSESEKVLIDKSEESEEEDSIYGEEDEEEEFEDIEEEDIEEEDIEEEDIEEEDIEEEEEDEEQKLEKSSSRKEESKNVLSHEKEEVKPPEENHNPESSKSSVHSKEKNIPTASKSKEKHKKTKVDENIPKEESDGEVEIIFENEKGELLDDVKIFLEKKGNVDIESLKKIKSDLKETKILDSDTHKSGNTIPPNIEELEVNLGIIVVCIPISNFFKSISSYEKDLLELYYHIDENEMEERERKLNEIQKMCDKFVENSRKIIEKKTKKELKIKGELIAITGVIADIKRLKEKTAEDPVKFKSDIIKLNDIYEESKKSIHYLNSDLLKIKDEIHECLSNYTLLLKEGLKV
jgi:hypothetical protein